MVTDAASKAQRRCDNDGAGDEDAHVNSPVLMSLLWVTISILRGKAVTLLTRRAEN